MHYPLANFSPSIVQHKDSLEILMSVFRNIKFMILPSQKQVGQQKTIFFCCPIEASILI